ncbi:MAG: DNA mismatch repair protein MutS [Bacteroidota bacterium]|nr:DNA mismatch repair protein MutS [Bacteroidota bacterium]
MQIDQTTYSDLSVFETAGEFSLFNKLDQTRTVGGRMQLYQFFNQPLGSLEKILETQQILGIILRNENAWAPSISNGTVMVMEKFYETALENIPGSYDLFSAGAYKFFHTPDYSLTRYSITHFADFIRGMKSIASLADTEDCPSLLKGLLQRIGRLLDHDVLNALVEKKPERKFTAPEVVQYGYFIRNRFKTAALDLIAIYGKLDAWYSMAMACKRYQLVMPEFIQQDEPYIEISDLYHLLLAAPVSYHVKMDPGSNFVFLTGANMAGKSTFIKAIGCSLFLAHLGMGVPASNMKLSLFDGILSNINVVDNLVKGESYFYNEVQRIKKTLIQISDKKKWLVLIDELFKGTNVEDAMKCSSAVIRGLIKIKSSLFVLSTHLYEIAQELKSYPNISFKFFETNVSDHQLEFNYQLRDGISNDRIGYLILEREGVVELLDRS